MKKTIIGLVLSLSISWLVADEITFNTPDGSFTLSVSGTYDDNQVKEGRVTSGMIIENIGKKLERIERDYHSKLSRLDQARARQMMNEVYALLAQLPTNETVKIEKKVLIAEGSSSHNGTVVEVLPPSYKDDTMLIQEKPTHPHHPPVEPKPEEKRIPMPEYKYSTFLGDVGRESFADNKMRIIRVESKNSYFTVNQIIRVIETITFSEDKMQALRIMYPRVTDPENSSQIIKSLTFSEDKEEAERIINLNN